MCTIVAAPFYCVFCPLSDMLHDCVGPFVFDLPFAVIVYACVLPCPMILYARGLQFIVLAHSRYVICLCLACVCVVDL